jgi:flagellar biosynthesis/type III secretory pathway chaperone
MGLARLIAWCDPSRSLATRYDECSTRARRCRELNDRNGILVGAQMKRVEGLLGAMTGANSEPRSYGPRGMSNPYAASTGKVLSAEA